MSAEYAEGGASAPAPTRRPGRGGDGGAPISGALTIILAIVAVVAGFLILRAITGDGGGGGSAVGPGPSATTEPEVDPDATTTTMPEITTTTEPPLVFTGATVVVANANNVNGSAGAMTRELEAAGFTLGTAVNAAATVGQLENSVIYFDSTDEGARAVAESVNRLMGADMSISPVPETAPTADGTLEGQVLLMLGNDKAGSTLDELAPEPAAAVPSPGAAGDGDAEDAGTDEVDPDEDPDG